MFNYDNLWKLLIDKGMKKKDLVHGARITPTAVAKMGKGQPVSLEISDLVEYERRDEL